jgi:hypothetical protein
MTEPGPSVVGRRPMTPGRLPTGSDESVIGNRAAGRGPMGGAGERGALRGRGAATPRAVESVVVRETPGTGARRSAGARSAPGTEDGVVRPSRRTDEAGGRGGAGSRRSGRRREEQDQVGEGKEGTEMWEVNDGVPAVVEPPAVFDGSAERPGPHVGGRRRR